MSKSITGIGALSQLDLDETLDELPTIKDRDPDDKLIVDKESYIAKQYSEAKLKKKNITAFKEFSKKAETLENINYKKFLEMHASQYTSKDSFWEYYWNNYKKFRLFPPTDYSYCNFNDNEKDISISKINERLRFGGHFHLEDFTLYLFWIEHDINQIYPHVF